MASGENAGERRSAVAGSAKNFPNFDLARKATPPLYIVEGQPDTVTLYAAGLRNVCGLSSSSFTADHLQLLLRNDPPIKHVIFCLDPDKAGKAGTARAIKTIEEVTAGNIGLQVDIVAMPEGGGDPDKFVRTFGIKSFRGLERLDLFSWRMKEAVEAGQDCLQVAENAVGLILNEPNILRRRQMAKRLASVTGQPEDSIWAEVERRVDVDKAAAQEQKASIAHKMIREITKNPSRAAQFIAEASSEIELVEKAKHGYDLRSAVGALNMAYERADKNDSRIGLYTGFPIFDDKMRGIPKFDKFISVPGKPNAGKALALTAKLKTPYGWILNRDVRVGDELASVDGEPNLVTGVFPQGIEKVYRVTFSDGRSVEASGSHLWKVHFIHEYKEGSGSDIHNGWHVFTTDSIRAFCLNGSHRNGHRSVYVPLASGDFGYTGSLPIDPWLLGVLLGDGGLTNGTPIVTKPDSEIIDRVAEEIKAFGLHLEPVVSKGEQHDGWRLSSGHHNGPGSNLLNTELRNLGLMGLDSSEKFIPGWYLNADRESRWELLRGLLDTDGTRGNRSRNCPGISYCTTSLRLAKDVQELIRSLGGICKIGKPKQSHYTYKAEKRNGKLAYILHVRLPEREKAFFLERKKVDPRVNQCRLTITDIEYIGEKETQCITVSHPSKLFITDDYIVTHKSTWFDNLAWRIAENKQNKDVLVFFHSADDSLYERHSRILGSRFNIPSEMFESPGFYLGDAEACKQRGCENFEEVLGQARQWLKGLFEAERLIVADISEVSPSFPALGKYVCDIRKRFPDKHIVVLEDNFHLLEMPGYTPGEAKIAASSHFIKQLCTREQITCLSTMEITKSDLTPGKRPFFTNLKGSGAIPYDINCNLSIHNDLADLLDDAKVWWDDVEHQVEVQTDGVAALENTRMPILEVISDKNKISGFKGTIFFKMWPMSGRLEECSQGENTSYLQSVE